MIQIWFLAQVSSLGKSVFNIMHRENNIYNTLYREKQMYNFMSVICFYLLILMNFKEHRDIDLFITTYTTKDKFI